jgi:hypothetical protein
MKPLTRHFTSIELVLALAFIVMLQSCASILGTTDQDWREAMTRNTELRTTSSQAATAGKLSKADLAETLKRNDEIRALLDRSRKENSVSRTMSIRSAKSKLTDLEAFLKGKGVQVPAQAAPPKSSSQPTKKEKS